MKAIVFALVALLLTGCSALGLTPAAGAAPVEIGGDISGDLNQSIENTIQQMTWWQFATVCLLAGWAIPGPGEMFRAIFGVFGSAFSGLLSLIRIIKGK